MSDTVPEQAAQMKVCPSCAEPVRAAARVCRYCGYNFDQPSRAGLTTASQSPSAGAILTTIAGALLTLGPLLPWASVHLFTRTIRRSGIHWAGGILVLVLGIAVLLGGIAALSRVRLPNLTGVVIIVAGIVAGVAGIWEFARVSTRLSTFRDLSARFGAPRFLGRLAGAHIGIGLWVVIAGAVLAIVGGFLMQIARAGSDKRAGAAALTRP
jgi:hypothetical protein